MNALTKFNWGLVGIVIGFVGYLLSSIGVDSQSNNFLNFVFIVVIAANAIFCLKILYFWIKPKV